MKKNKICFFTTSLLLCLTGCNLEKENSKNFDGNIVTPIVLEIGKPTPTMVPTPTATPVPAIAPTAIPTPTPSTIPTPTATPAPKIDNYNLPIYKIDYNNTRISTSKTLNFVNNFNYYSHSLTNINKKQMNLNELKESIKDYGKWVGNIGMSDIEYKNAMNYKWKDCTQYNQNYENINFDLTKSYTYKDLVEVMKKLSSIDGVYLYNIGESTAGNDMFALEIDKTTVENPEIIVLTGTVHARETAGSTFIIKQLVDLLNSKDEENIKDYLSKIKIVAVPCVNPDGREGVAFDTKNFTYSDGQYWKATSNGTDINRNFPGLSWGQCKNGYSRVYGWSDSSNSLYYPGDSAGSCNETKALMKLLYHYIVIEKASTLIDYHQQGRLAYAGKPWQTKEQEQRCVDFAKDIFKYTNQENSTKYVYTPEDPRYGLQGEGSTLTDFACSLAVGAKFSRQYGFYVMYKDNVEYPLVTFSDLDKAEFEEANKNFRTMTFEIGSGRNYLGYSEKTRKLLNTEYYTYHFDTILYKIFDNTLENSLSNQEKIKVLTK